MKVVLRTTVPTLGRRGDICEVADGYAQNYLIPRKLATQANKGSLRQAEAMRRARELQDARRLEEVREMAGRLEQCTVAISARASEAGRLFGSVNAAALVAAISEQTKVALPPSVVNLPEPIKQIGAHSVQLSIHEEVSVTLTVEVAAA